MAHASDALPAAVRQAGEAASPGELEGYVPRPLLTEPPVLLAPVVIGEPGSTDEPPVGIRKGILALYIDGEGRVRAVLGEDPILPADYEQAAREAFLAARYAPGRINGKAVRSRVRVEVQFSGGVLRQ